MTLPSALVRIAPRIPPDLWGRIETWLTAFERQELDTELVIVLRLKRGKVTRTHIKPPEETIGWPGDKRASA